MSRALVIVALVFVLASGTAAGLPGRTGWTLTFTQLVPHNSHGLQSVWVARSDGSDTRKVAPNGHDSALSADGRWLIFTRGYDQDARLFLVDLATGATRSLGASRNVRWSLVADRFALLDARGIYLVDAQSGDRTTLLEDKQVGSFDLSPDGRSIVFARVHGRPELGGRSDLFLLRLSDRRVIRLTSDGRSTDPLISKTGIAYVRYRHVHISKGFDLDSPETWWMRLDSSRAHLVARCCESKQHWAGTGGGKSWGIQPAALSADGRHLLACEAWEGGCSPIPIDLTTQHRYAYPDLTQDGWFLDALDLSSDGRTVLIDTRDCFICDPKARIYSTPFARWQPRLLVRSASGASWRA